VCGNVAPIAPSPPLLHGAYKGDLQLIQRLLPLSTMDGSNHQDQNFIAHVRKEANVRDAWNNTALHWAVRGGSVRSVDIARHLITAGVDVDARNNGGSSALHWASSVAIEDISRSLISLLLSPSSDIGMSSSTQTGIYVNTINHAGETPLHWAVDWLRPHAVEALLDAGADPNKVDVDGNSPLHKIKKDCDQNEESVGTLDIQSCG
jgi:ankyrin repeat protein